MNIKINGNVVTLVSRIPFADLADLGTISILDEDKKPVYAVCVSSIPSISKMGVSFTFSNDNGNACVNFVTDVYDVEMLRECFIRANTEELELLKKYEDIVIAAIEEKKASLEALAALVEIG